MQDLRMTDRERGLTEEEARIRLEKYGKNEFAKKKPASLLTLFWRQINNFLIYILIAAAVISAFVGEISDAVIIVLVILLNSVIGLVQETKAEQALEELKKISTPTSLVKRDGLIKEIKTEDLVPGDLVLLESGRYVPADLLLIETVHLKIEESQLTGESLSVEKDAEFIGSDDLPLADRKNMAFMSSLVTYGRGLGLVQRTGMETEIGKIAKMLENQGEDKTPLQVKLDELGKIIGIGAVVISMLIFIIGYFQGRDLLEIFLISISLAVAAIPEGLPAIVAIVLALGVRRMIKRNAIVRRLPAVETLGAVSIICSDKTGTLTENKMTVVTNYVNENLLPTEELIQASDSTSDKYFLCLALCNNASLEGEEGIGEPTELALLEAASLKGFQKQKLEEEYRRLAELPFDSDRKMMSTVHQAGEGNILFAKGAYESILSRSSFFEKSGQMTAMTEEKRKELDQIVDQLSEEAYRVLAIAYKELDGDLTGPTIEEEGLIFLGLACMIDPPRKEVKSSIEQCKKAGIDVVMITGDHQKTALAIARDLHLAQEEDQTMTGQELEGLSDEELINQVEDIKVFARVSPEHKVRIVQALKARERIVSMTGDGVNDAPSLQAADVGVAMGITGTDVAKGAADIVLTDDNFSTITAAIEEGRNIYQNIKKSVLFLLSCNLGEVITLLIGILMGWPAPLTAIQILWVNLVTDSLPAIALGIDQEDPDVMKKSPRPIHEKILLKEDFRYSILNGFLIACITLFAFLLGLSGEQGLKAILTLSFDELSREATIQGQTMAFITLSVSQLFHAFNLRSFKQSIFKLGIFSNPLLILSVLFGLALQVMIVEISFFQNLFHISSLGFGEWMQVLGLSLLTIVFNELAKAFRRRKGKASL